MGVNYNSCTPVGKTATPCSTQQTKQMSPDVKIWSRLYPKGHMHNIGNARLSQAHCIMGSQGQYTMVIT